MADLPEKTFNAFFWLYVIYGFKFIPTTTLFIRLMITSPTTKRLHVSLTDQECLILKAFALGVSSEKICRLLDVSTSSFQNSCTSLYTKLQVENSFAAVQVAFQKKILTRKEYCPERIKALALEYASNKIDSRCDLSHDKKALWECYDLLIDFYAYMEGHLLPHKHFQTQ